MRNEQWAGTDPVTGKRNYFSRAAARKVIRRMGGRRMAAYRNPHNPMYWHIGHLPRAVKQGVTTRHEHYERNQ